MAAQRLIEMTHNHDASKRHGSAHRARDRNVCALAHICPIPQSGAEFLKNGSCAAHEKLEGLPQALVPRYRALLRRSIVERSADAGATKSTPFL